MNWVATELVPTEYRVGRVKAAKVSAIPAEDQSASFEQSYHSNTQTSNIESSAMATQTATVSAAALMLANTGSSGGIANFFAKPAKCGGGGNPSGGSGPPGRRGGRGGTPRGGGALPGGASAGGSGGGVKLGGNPPTEFDGNRSKVEEFMHQFSLYRLTNIDAKQMANPMKRMVLFLRFIKGPNVKHWVKHWITWTIQEFNTGRAPTDEFYWTEIVHGFQNAFQDTGSRERADDKLCHMVFTPGDVDMFITQFESLAEEATYSLNTKLTLTLFASKLPFKMMDHILKVIRPHDFQGWADVARQYHQDNMAVQNIMGILMTLRASPHSNRGSQTPLGSHPSSGPRY